MLFKYFILLQWRNPVQLLLPIVLFISLTLVMVMTDTNFQPLLAFVIAIFSTVPFLFNNWLKNDFIAQLWLNGISLQLIAIMQFACHWLFVSFPLLLLTALWQGEWSLSLVLTTFGLHSLTIIIAALLSSTQSANASTSGIGMVLLLPLSVPLIIFATEAATTKTAFLWLSALTFIYLAAFPWLTGVLLREGIKN